MWWIWKQHWSIWQKRTLHFLNTNFLMFQLSLKRPFQLLLRNSKQQVIEMAANKFNSIKTHLKNGFYGKASGTLSNLQTIRWNVLQWNLRNKKSHAAYRHRQINNCWLSTDQDRVDAIKSVLTKENGFHEKSSKRSSISLEQVEFFWDKPLRQIIPSGYQMHQKT